ncbi:MAG: TlpA disulfide reductase family protein [Candidatus Cloacimonadales bacterium]|nr:TlpA disulfide reductase family protein [Candidatus Cloacimonadales bacterium]
MKKLIGAAIICWMIFSCTQKPGFIINGKIANADDKLIVLVKMDGRNSTTIDSTIIRNGNFTMKGSVDFPDLFRLEIIGVDGKCELFLENSNITVTGVADSLQDLVITGSRSEDEYKAYLQLLVPIGERMEVIYQEYPIAQQAGDETKIQELFDQYLEIETETIEIGKKFIADHPASFVSPGILGHLANNLEAIEIEELINTLDEKVAVIPSILKLKEKVIILKKTNIGQPAPDFELNNVNGNPVKLSDKIGTKLLLLDFWAAWCNPCREENPNVVAVYQKYKDKGFDVFGVSLDQDKESWLQAIEADKLTWTHVSQLEGWTCDAVEKYAVSSIPANFLLDENGIIIAKNLRGEDLENKVKEILGE